MGDKPSHVNTRGALGIMAPAFFSVSTQQSEWRVANSGVRILRCGRPRTELRTGATGGGASEDAHSAGGAGYGWRAAGGQ